MTAQEKKLNKLLKNNFKGFTKTLKTVQKINRANKKLFTRTYQNNKKIMRHGEDEIDNNFNNFLELINFIMDEDFPEQYQVHDLKLYILFCAQLSHERMKIRRRLHILLSPSYFS